MEISKIRVSGCHKVSVIFTGEQYIFHNAEYGIVAVAERDSRRELESGFAACRFVLTVENWQTQGGNCTAIEAAAKRFIRREECRYIPRCVEIDVRDGGNLNAEYFIDCAVRPRK